MLGLIGLWVSQFSSVWQSDCSKDQIWNYLFIIYYYLLFIYYCDSVIVLQRSHKITNHKSYTRSVSKYALAVISYEAGRHFILNLISHTCHTLDRLSKRPAGLPFSRRLSQSDLYVLKT